MSQELECLLDGSGSELELICQVPGAERGPRGQLKSGNPVSDLLVGELADDMIRCHLSPLVLLFVRAVRDGRRKRAGTEGAFAAYLGQIQIFE
jgi:hypothetical protein